MKLKEKLEHLFTPTEKNNYRAKTLHISFLTSYLFIIIILAGVFSIGKNVLGIATDITIQRLYELTNQKRAENGLSTLQSNEQLNDAARRKASDMISKKYWAHFGPNGESPWQFISASGYAYEIAGENLAKDFCCSSDVVSAWMDSPTHRENILRSDYQDVGFAIVNGFLEDEETTLVVQMFGSGKSTTPTQNTLVQQVEAEEKQTPTATILKTTPLVAKRVVTSPILPTLQPSSTPVITPIVYNTGTTFTDHPKSMTLSIFSLARKTTSNLSFMAIIILALALISDLYYAYKLDIIRFNSKNIAHILFVGVMLIGFIIISKGSIL